MLNNETILVFGATGNQGGAVIKTLISESERENKTITLRILVRNPDSDTVRAMQQKGVEVIKGSMENPESLQKALVGVSRVFLNTTHDKYGGESWIVEKERGEAVIRELIKMKHLKQVVYSTLPSIDGYSEGAGKSAVEEQMRKANLPITTVLSPFYFENFINVWPPIRRWLGVFGPLQWGWLPTGKELRMPHGSVDDFGVVVANILLRPVNDYLNRQVTVVSEDLLLTQVLTEMECALGEPIQWKPMKRNVFRCLPLPKEAIAGLEFYADALDNHSEVEQGFLISEGIGAESLESAMKETREIHPKIQSVSSWTSTNKKKITKRSLKKTLVSAMMVWARCKSLVVNAR